MDIIDLTENNYIELVNNRMLCGLFTDNSGLSFLSKSYKYGNILDFQLIESVCKQ